MRFLILDYFKLRPYSSKSKQLTNFITAYLRDRTHDADDEGEDRDSDPALLSYDTDYAGYRCCVTSYYVSLPLTVCPSLGIWPSDFFPPYGLFQLYTNFTTTAYLLRCGEAENRSTTYR